MGLFGKSDEEKEREEKARYDDAQRKLQEARKKQQQEQAAKQAAAKPAPAAPAGLGPKGGVTAQASSGVTAPAGKVVPAAATETVVTYTVQKGDSLSKIAKKQLGDGNAWRKIYEANKSVIGDNPDKILPGQQLRIPAGAGGPKPGGPTA